MNFQETLEFSDSEWERLVRLAHARSNVSRSFKTAKEAVSYLRKL